MSNDHAEVFKTYKSFSYDGVTVSARSHEASATAIGSTIMGVTDTCRTKWVQDPLTATGSANPHCYKLAHHSRIKGHFVTILTQFAVDVRRSNRSQWVLFMGLFLGPWFQTLSSFHISIYCKISFKMFENQNGPLS